MPLAAILPSSQLMAADFPVGILTASNWLSYLSAKVSEGFGR